MSVVTLQEHTFLPRPLGPDSVVLDLGANAGAFSTAMIRRFGCTCHAVEANPAMADQIPAGPRLHVHRHAMGGTPGAATFHVSTDPLGSSFFPIDTAEYTDVLTVPVETLGGLMKREGLDRVDLVKADIEGAEVPMFEACSDQDLLRADQITTEFHDFNDTTPEADVRRVLDRFRDLGFEVYRKSKKGHCDVLALQADRLDVSAAELAWIRVGRHYLTGTGRVVKKAVGLGS
jgi:FkbM family methyltransferase